MPLDLSILGQGVYTPREVARLIGATPQEIIRWTRGSGPSDPLWKGYYQEIDDSAELSFADLVEVRVVKSLRNAKVSMQAIRFAIQLANEKYEIDRPLSSLGFRTDGQEILIEALEKDGQLMSLSKKRPGQKVFKEIVQQSLVGLEYDEDRPVRWRPENTKHIVIDPTRFFGEPIIDKFGVSSNTLYREFGEFGDIRYLSQIYEIPTVLIKDAISFESSLDSTLGKKHGQSTI